MFPYWRLSSFYFFYFALIGSWLPFWPLYLEELNYSAQQIGIVAGVVMATKVISPSVWGWLATRTSSRDQVIRYGAFLAIISFVFIFVDRRFYSLLGIVFVFSFFWNAILAQFEVVTLSHLRLRYHRYSQIRVWGSVGFIFVVTILGWLFDFISLSWLPWIVTALLIAIWLSSLTVSERKRPFHNPDNVLPVTSILKQPTVIGFFVVCFLLQLSHGPYYTFFSVYLESNGYNRLTTGLLWSLGVVAEVVIFIFMHKLMVRFSLRQIMLVSLMLSIIRWLMIAFFVENIVLLAIAQTLHAASFGSYHAFAVETVRRAFKGGAQGQGMALYSGLSFGAGGAVGAIISGYLWDMSEAMTFILAAIVCTLALMLSLRLNLSSFEK